MSTISEKAGGRDAIKVHLYLIAPVNLQSGSHEADFPTNKVHMSTMQRIGRLSG
jgi:hypothetical protein